MLSCCNHELWWKQRSEITTPVCMCCHWYVVVVYCGWINMKTMFMMYTFGTNDFITSWDLLHINFFRAFESLAMKQIKMMLYDAINPKLIIVHYAMLMFVASQPMCLFGKKNQSIGTHIMWTSFGMVNCSFWYSPTSPKISNMRLGNTRRWWINPSQGHSPFSSWCLGARMINLFIELKISILLKWSHRSPPSSCLLNPNKQWNLSTLSYLI